MNKFGFFLLTLILLFTSCRKEKPLIRIGSNLWPGYDFLYLAKEKGFFAEAGVNVQLFDFVSLSDSRRAFERGQVDIIAGTIVEMLIIGNNSSIFPQTFYVADFSNGADVILGRKPISSILDLKGKRVGVEPSSLDLLTINLALKQNQMSIKDITLVPMAQNGMEENYDRSMVDALCTFPPTSVRIMNKGNANILFNSSQIPGYIVDVLISNKKFIDSRTADLAKVIECFDRAVQYTKDHPEEALPVIAEHEQITVKELREAYNGIAVEELNHQNQYLRNNGQLFKATQVALEILKETGVIQKEIDIQDLINPAPVNFSLTTIRKNE
ncbi:MAG: ABC transporter substrate-binding protein [Bacteroidota bacterium]